ncbi:MAG: pyrroline-5-carboxylate reductase [Clostridiales bacterium 43-6]|nr:MAG: pyrroline-5-carboxylate reductase [Clostridiales bacterium 43-6]
MKIGFIGAGGNMAGAIIKGILNKGYINPSDINLYDVANEKLDIYKEYGMQVFNSNYDIALNSDFIFLCIKPQTIKEALADIKSVINANKCLVSIVAGVGIKTIQAEIGSDCKVIRVMPNTPLLVGYGATALVHEPPVTAEEFNFVKDVFQSSGITEICSEDDINTVTAVSGSGPAYVFQFAKAVIEEAQTLGMEKEKAANLFINTLIGSAVMLRDSGFSADELIRMVTSPNGTTYAALQSLESDDFNAIVKRAVAAAKNRADELGRPNKP